MHLVQLRIPKQADIALSVLAELGFLDLTRASPRFTYCRPLLLLLELRTNAARLFANFGLHLDSDLADITFKSVKLDRVVDHQVHVRFPCVNRLVLVRFYLATNGSKVPCFPLRNNVVVSWNLKGNRVNGLPKDEPAGRMSVNLLNDIYSYNSILTVRRS